MNYMKIDDCDLNNGDGARVVLWVGGCKHACAGCHNMETWSLKAGSLFTDVQMQKILSLLDDKYISGLTISGGDPLLHDNFEQVLSICQKVKQVYPNKTIWIWTGYTIEQLQKDKRDEIFKYIDTLIDGKYVAKLTTTKKWRGSDNQKRFNMIDGKPHFID